MEQYDSSSINPWTWNEDRIKQWFYLNDLSDFIQPIFSRYHMNGMQLMQLKESQISFLSYHYNYPRFVGRLTSLQQLYKKVLLFTNIADNSTVDGNQCTIDKNTHTLHQNASQDNNNNFTEPNEIDDIGARGCKSSMECSYNFYRCLRQHDDNLVQLKAEYNYAANSKFTIQRLCIAVLLCILGFVFCSCMTILADERTPPRDIFPPLPDIFLDNIRRIAWATSVSEVIIVLLNICFVAILIIRYDRLIILKRCCLMLTMIYTFRGITVYCTSLSVVGNHLTCAPKNVNLTSMYNRFHRVMTILTNQGLQMYGLRTCGDYIFSGHTCTIMLMSHFITFYIPRRLWPLKILIWLVSIFAIGCILASHFHYTVDVVLAVVITSNLFSYYNALCRCKSLFDEHTKSRMLIYIPAFYFFESKETCSIDYECDDFDVMLSRTKLFRCIGRYCHQLYQNMIFKLTKQQGKLPVFFEKL